MLLLGGGIFFTTDPNVPRGIALINTCGPREFWNNSAAKRRASKGTPKISQVPFRVFFETKELSVQTPEIVGFWVLGSKPLTLNLGLDLPKFGKSTNHNLVLEERGGK